MAAKRKKSKTQRPTKRRKPLTRGASPKKPTKKPAKPFKPSKPSKKPARKPSKRLSPKPQKRPAPRKKEPKKAPRKRLSPKPPRGKAPPKKRKISAETRSKLSAALKAAWAARRAALSGFTPKERPGAELERLAAPPPGTSLPAPVVLAENGLRGARELISEGAFQEEDLAVPPLDVLVRTFFNQDETWDGELRVRAIPRGVEVRDVLLALEQALPQHLPGTTISIGFLFPPPTNEEQAQRYAVHDGMSQTQTNYMRSEDKAIVFDTARGSGEIQDPKDVRYGVVRWMARKKLRKLAQIFVRLHWGADGARPARQEAAPYPPRHKR